MAALPTRAIPPLLRPGRAGRLVERNLMVYRRGWLVILSGFFEPLFYLAALGVGVGRLVGDIDLPGGDSVTYTAFVAPALLASSAMNGAVYDSTFNIFDKLKWRKVYDAVLATPVEPRDVALGELTWSLLRGLAYAAAFLVVMLALGLVASPWAVLALPAAALIGFAFAGCGMASVTFMRSWQDFEWVQLAVLPMFLFSATFYPLDVYPGALQGVVRLSPLYQGVTLMRGLTLGDVGPGLVVAVVYLATLGLAGLAVASRRIGVLLRT